MTYKTFYKNNIMKKTGVTLECTVGCAARLPANTSAATAANIAETWANRNKTMPYDSPNNQVALNNGLLRPAWYDYILFKDLVGSGMINYFSLENYTEY